MPDNWKILYQHLGYFFYSIAAADNDIADAEIDVFKKLLRESWITLEDSTDEFGSDASFQIEVVFDWLLDNKKSADFAYGEFEKYYNENKSDFSPGLKRKMMETSAAIAGAYSGTNKSEKELLKKAQEMLK